MAFKFMGIKRVPERIVGVFAAHAAFTNQTQADLLTEIVEFYFDHHATPVKPRRRTPEAQATLDALRTKFGGAS